MPAPSPSRPTDRSAARPAGSAPSTGRESDRTRDSSSGGSGGGTGAGSGSSGGGSSGRGLERVVFRNLYAYALLRRAVFLAFVALACAALSLCSAYQVVRVKTPPQFIQLTTDGRIYPVAPLSVRSVSDADIIKFAADSVKWTNTYDYQSWRDQLQQVSDRFSPDGWNNFLTTLVASGNMNSVTSQHMVVSVKFHGTPDVAKQGIVKSLGVYTWLVNVPVEVLYTSPSLGGGKDTQTLSQNGVVHLYISRVPLSVNLRGYAIQVYQFEAAGGTAAVKPGA